eukprot:gene6425-6656_t
MAPPGAASADRGCSAVAGVDHLVGLLSAALLAAGQQGQKNQPPEEGFTAEVVQQAASGVPAGAAVSRGYQQHLNRPAAATADYVGSDMCREHSFAEAAEPGIVAIRVALPEECPVTRQPAAAYVVVQTSSHQQGSVRGIHIPVTRAYDPEAWLSLLRIHVSHHFRAFGLKILDSKLKTDSQRCADAAWSAAYEEVVASVQQSLKQMRDPCTMQHLHSNADGSFSIALVHPDPGSSGSGWVSPTGFISSTSSEWSRHGIACLPFPTAEELTNEMLPEYAAFVVGHLTMGLPLNLMRPLLHILLHQQVVSAADHFQIPAVLQPFHKAAPVQLHDMVLM